MAAISWPISRTVQQHDSSRRRVTSTGPSPLRPVSKYCHYHKEPASSSTVDGAADNSRMCVRSSVESEININRELIDQGYGHAGRTLEERRSRRTVVLLLRALGNAELFRSRGTTAGESAALSPVRFRPGLPTPTHKSPSRTGSNRQPHPRLRSLSTSLLLKVSSGGSSTREITLPQPPQKLTDFEFRGSKCTRLLHRLVRERLFPALSLALP